MQKIPPSIPGEVWSDIQGFSRYAVSNYGHIWNMIFDRPMSPSKSTTGHQKISLIDDEGVRRDRGVALLVAEAFVDPPNYMCTEVIIKDGDVWNAAANNLAWRPPRVAYLYARQMRTEQPLHYHNLPVRNLNTGAVYKNIIQAGVTEGMLFEDIFSSCNNKWRVGVYGHTYEIVKKSII